MATSSIRSLQVMYFTAAERYIEDTALNLSNVVIKHPANGIVTAMLTLSSIDAGTLTTGTSGGVTSTFATGVWTASGAVESVNALLAAVSFDPASSFNGPLSIATWISDGKATPITFSKTLNLAAVNDAPTATNMSVAQTYTEDTPLNLADIVVSDTDSASVTATLALSNAAAGVLTTGTSGGVTSTFASGVWTATGAIANVNALLAAVTFNPAANF